MIVSPKGVTHICVVRPSVHLGGNGRHTQIVFDDAVMLLDHRVLHAVVVIWQATIDINISYDQISPYKRTNNRIQCM